MSRALSKDPQHRYATCREFVDALVKSPSSGETAFSDAVRSRPTPAESSGFAAEPRCGSGVPTDVFEDGESADWNLPPGAVARRLAAHAIRELIDLPPVDLTGRDDARPMPTLVLGIGGTAGRVLRQLRKLIHDRIAAAPLPAVSSSCCSTPIRGLSRCDPAAMAAGYRAGETLICRCGGRSTIESTRSSFFSG